MTSRHQQRQQRRSYNRTLLYTWQAKLMFQKRAALIGRAHFIASMARCLYYDMPMYPEVMALQAATKESVDGARNLLESMEKAVL